MSNESSNELLNQLKNMKLNTQVMLSDVMKLRGKFLFCRLSFLYFKNKKLNEN